MKKYLLIYLFVGWGLAVSGQSVIQSYEYWFNSNDNNKTVDAIATPAASFELAVQADASHLPDGLNSFTLRFRDSFGIWSSPLTRFFVKMPEQQFSIEPKNIVAYEYRLNNEPFVKQGVSPASSFVLEEQISAANLPDGLNTFTVRFKDDLGNWSSPLTRFFVKIPEQQFSTEPKNIVAYEYRLNSASSVKQEVAPATTYVLDQQIEATQLPDGLNVFMVRFRDNLGNWSSPLTRFFVKMPEIDTAVSENLIKAYEYRVEDASGNAVAGSGSTTFTFVGLDAPIDPALIEFEVALNHVPMGDYTVHFRALDIRNHWSSVLSRTVEKEAIPMAEFSFTGGLCSGSAIQFANASFDADTWLWDFGDGTTSAEFEPEHVYTEARDFDVKLVVTDSESGQQDSVVHSVTIHSTQESLASVEICASETPYTFGMQQLTESGTFTEIFQTIHGCDSVVTLNLTVHPTYNVTIGQPSNFQVNDSFEEDAIGTLAGWTIKYNGSGNANQKVVDNISKNGSKSFQLEGRSSWAADLYKPITDTPDKLTIEAWINVTIANAAASGIGLVNYGAASWGARTSRIDFSNGRIRATCTGGAIYDIQPFTPGEWYHVRVEHDLVARVYSVYIDGQKVSGNSGSTSTDVFPMHPAVSQDFFLCAGNATTTRVYFDDVKMYETANPAVTINASETPYIFGTQQLTESGTYTEVFQTIHGCDSVVTLNLIVKASSICADLELKSGWNILSSPVLPDSTELEFVFQPLIDNSSLVKIQDEGGKSLEDWGAALGGWKNTIGNMTLTEGYKVKANWVETLEVCGNMPEFPFAIPLKNGWNITGYPQLSEFDGMGVVQQLRDRGTLLKVQDESGKSLEDWGASLGGWKNNIGNFLPGKGYKIKVNADDTLWINESYPKSNSILPEEQPGIHFRPAFEGNGVDHMNINLVALPANVLNVGDELAVFDGDICVGTTVLLSHHFIDRAVSISASASDGQGMTGFNEANHFSLKLWKADRNLEFNLEPEILRGSPFFVKHESVFASLDKYATTGFGEWEIKTNEINCYPNPFKNELGIEIKLSIEAEVQVDVFNQLGQKVKPIAAKTTLNSGIHRLTWNGKNNVDQQVSPGVYFIKIKIADENYFEKVIFNRME